MRRLAFHTLDVFTARRFGGNPLAVFADGRDLSDAEMQAIAAEINYSETTFILPPEDPAHAARVRIFTPKHEIPFAGHPNVGTGFLLSRRPDLIPGANSPDEMIFEEDAGLVRVVPQRDDTGLVIATTITAPQPLTLEKTVPVSAIAACANLAAEDIKTSRIEPTVCGTGLPFAIAEVASRAKLAAALPDVDAFHRANADHGYAGDSFSLMLFVEAEDSVLHARMFAPLGGIYEDPATGSACAALGSLLAKTSDGETGDFEYVIHQGEDMGRASRIEVSVTKRNGACRPPVLRGTCIEMMEGIFFLDETAAF